MGALGGVGLEWLDKHLAELSEFLGTPDFLGE